MSSSVTVVGGVVRTKRSITVMHNNPTPSEGGAASDEASDEAREGRRGPPDHAPAHGRGRPDAERSAARSGDADQPEAEWDDTYSGRNFVRRTRSV